MYHSERVREVTMALVRVMTVMVAIEEVSTLEASFEVLLRTPIPTAPQNATIWDDHAAVAEVATPWAFTRAKLQLAKRAMSPLLIVAFDSIHSILVLQFDLCVPLA